MQFAFFFYSLLLLLQKVRVTFIKKRDFMQRRSLFFWLIALFSIGLLYLHAWVYYPFISDDAFISLRYAQRFAEGKGLTWNDGEYVEGYSNFLWVLLLSFLGKCAVDLVTAARLLGGLCAAGAVIAALFPHRKAKTLFPAAVLGLCLAASGSFAVWVIGGLEQPLVAFLLAWAMVLSYPLVGKGPLKASQLLLPGLFFALLCLARPDGPLFTAAVALALFFCGKSIRNIALFCTLPALFFLGHTLFRLWYYGDFIPNSSYIRFPIDETVLRSGLLYVLRGIKAHLLVLLPPCIAGLFLLRQKEKRPLLLLLSLPLFLWLLYVVVVGGDIFPAYRHFVPVLILAALILGEGLELLEWKAPHLVRYASASAFVLLLAFLYLQKQNPAMQRAQSERWEWNHKAIGLLLHRSFDEKKTTIAVNAAGAIPYYSEMRTIDMLGINDKHIAKMPKPAIGDTYLAHDHGDGAYILKQRPDLVLMSPPFGSNLARYSSELELLEMPAFHARYRRIYLEGEEPTTVWANAWIKERGGSVGMRMEKNRIEIPGYLMATQLANRARLSSQQRLGAALHKKHPLWIKQLPLSAGLWKVVIEAEGSAEAALLDSKGPLTATQTHTFHIPRKSDYELKISTSEQKESLVLHVLLKRVHPRPGSADGPL